MATLVQACRREAPTSSGVAATPAARKALGAAAAFVPSPISDGEALILNTSFVARRQRAWDTVARVLAPVPTTVAGVSLPAFATWDAREDYERMFHALYDASGKEARRQRAPLAPAALEAVEAWNAHMLDELPNWSAARYAAFVQALTNDERRHGLTGLNRTLYSPALIRHMMASYRAIDACLDGLPSLSFSWKSPDPANFTACFDREFPPAAAAVKTVWSRADFGFELPVYDTSAEGLEAHLSHPEAGWGDGDSQARPTAPAIYEAQLEGGSRFRLAALHIMTKEQREWTWITLWWSASPDTDFGEDRPASVRALGEPWTHYKMCVVTTYDEAAVVSPELTGEYPTLAAALATAQRHTGPDSWCSNPYIELGAHNQLTNCIGCHQHAGSSFGSQDVLADGTRFPGGGRRRVRENFPADYLWSFGKEPERISGYIRAELQHYDVYDNIGR